MTVPAVLAPPAPRLLAPQSPAPVVARFTLPIPPSVNHVWRNVRGRVVLSEAARAYRDAVYRPVFLWFSTLPAQQRPKLPLTQPLAVSLVFVPGTARDNAMDLDNLFKATLDALTHARLWADDHQIDELHAVRAPAAPHQAGLRVVVSEMARS